jgi:hypothetical protein
MPEKAARTNNNKNIKNKTDTNKSENKNHNKNNNKPRIVDLHSKRTVYIVDNGGTPFVVLLTSDDEGPGVAHVFVDKTMYDSDLHDKSRDFKDVSRQDEWLSFWRSIKYTRAFVGLDPEEARPRGIFDKIFGGNPWWWGGNSLLLELAPKSYVFVGWEIYAFKTPDVIEQYVSQMGGSAVPYPYAIGAKNIYLLIQRTYLTNTHAAFLRSKMPDTDDDPYALYYRSDLDKGGPAGTRQRQNTRDLYEASHRLMAFKLLKKRNG